MTIGEKIHFYRKSNKLTQKQLAELSGVSEISIRKYEAGDRFPKLAQLQKIASVLPIGGDELLEVTVQPAKLDTIGDAMKLLYLLKERLGMRYTYALDADGNIDIHTIQIRLENDAINTNLARIITEESMVSQLKQELAGTDDELSQTQLLADQFLLDVTKAELTSDQTSLYSSADAKER